MKKSLFFLVVFLGFSVSLRADVLTLSNGDVVHGSWERVVGGNLFFKSDTLGELTIPMDKVKLLESSSPATALLPDGTMVEGRLSVSADGKWQLLPGTPGAAPVEHFVAVYPQKESSTLARGLHARPWQDWKGTGSVGYSLISGDTQSRSLTVNVNATRIQPDVPGIPVKWRSNFFLTTLFSRAKTSNSAAEISSRTFSSGLRQDRLFAMSNFVFVLAQYDYIQPQGIKLRQTYGGGFGRDMLHRPHLIVSVLGGLTYVRTRLENTSAFPLPPDTPLLQNSAEVLAGEKVSASPTKWLKLVHTLNFYPNLSQTGEYRFDTNNSLAVVLTHRFSLSISFVDFYLSNPLPNNHKNNATLSTGVGVNF